MNSTIKHILRFVCLLALQLLLINNLHWLGAFHPYVYVLALLMLPASMPRWVEMFIGAAIGLLMDACCTTAGVHMAACVAVAYLRPLLLGQFVQDTQRIVTQVCTATVGARPFLLTVATLIVVHHALICFLEAWSLEHFGWLLLTTLISSAVTFVLAFLYDRTQQ
ncbi:MAG: rod shape-determining protein MreD [Paludibacteraceae bacterium]|nr:rod shape-determining protein MreD [Paludibacteraceae bacterium]